MFKSTISFVLVLLISVPAMAEYYRFWRGFKRSDITQEQFLEGLRTRLMPTTVTVGAGKGLTAYLPALPTTKKPSFVPDEIALVVYESEEKYKAIRATPEGQAYADMHWEVFEKEISKSAVPIALEPEAIMQADTAYHLKGENIFWKFGYTLIHIGVRKESFPKEQFLERLTTHVHLVAQNLSKLNGYLVLATPDYEIAYLNWTTEDQMNDDFVSASAQGVLSDRGVFMDSLMWSPAFDTDSFMVDPVVENTLYNLIFSP